MMENGMMPGSMIVGMVIGCALILVLVVLGIAALIKYLFFGRKS